MVAGKCGLEWGIFVRTMIYFLVIAASVAWAALALFSPRFNHLDKENESYKRKTD